MKKFFILVKKEMRELLTIQMLAPLLVVVVLFVFIGKIIGSQTTKSAKTNTPIAVMDEDNTASSASLVSALKNSHFDVAAYPNLPTDQAIAKAKAENEKALVIIPAGFAQNLQNRKPATLPTYTIMTSFSFTGSKIGTDLAVALAAVNDSLSRNLISEISPGADAAAIKQPVKSDDYVVIGDRQAHISAAAVSGYISSQTVFIPIILFLVIVMASQLIATSIATEKENKTLETLLSSPVSRRSIVAAKLVGAGLVALLTSAVYLVGMRYYINASPA